MKPEKTIFLLLFSLSWEDFTTQALTIFLEKQIYPTDTQNNSMAHPPAGLEMRIKKARRSVLFSIPFVFIHPLAIAITFGHGIVLSIQGGQRQRDEPHFFLSSLFYHICARLAMGLNKLFVQKKHLRKITASAF